MANYQFTAALNAADIPMISRQQQRSVIIAGTDNRLRDPTTSNTQNLDNNPQNLPQVIYAENVMPTSDGLTAVAYHKVENAFPAGVSGGEDVYELRDASENIWYLCPARGFNFVSTAIGAGWVSTSPIAGAPIFNNFSIAYVNGQTYICYANTYLGLWNGVNFTDCSGTLSGLAVINIRSIAGFGNYLLFACEDNSVKWSSLINPLDVVPSIISGAGSQIPSNIRGALTYLTPISGGFICHCFDNAVAALYTQNSASPWIFREVLNSGGTHQPVNQISKESTSGTIYINGSNGIQGLNLKTAETLSPQVSDFLLNQIIETFNPVTNQLSFTSAGSGLPTKISFLAGRYLCLSYGTTIPFDFVLIYDTVLKRWGKLAFTHTDIFVTKQNTGFDNVSTLQMLTSNGEVYSIHFGDGLYVASGVLIMGRYQINRSHNICSQEVVTECLDAGDAFTATVVANYNGTNFGEARPMTLYGSSDNYRRFQAQIEGENISFIFKGTFTITTMMLTATLGSRTE